MRMIAALILGIALLTGSLLPLGEIQAQPSTRRAMILLSEDQRTETTASPDITNVGENLNVRGAYLLLEVSGVQTTPLITLAVQARNPASGDYVGVFTATAGVSATATYLLYPGVGAAADEVTQIRSYPLPPVWRVQVSHADTDPITYSVSAVLVQ